MIKFEALKTFTACTSFDTIFYYIFRCKMKIKHTRLLISFSLSGADLAVAWNKTLNIVIIMSTYYGKTR